MPIDRSKPSLISFSINNNRTAWRNIGLPVILVVPHRRTAAGADVANSQVFNVRVAIEDVPQTALVAGQDHIGLIYPNRELYAKTISTSELLRSQINVSTRDFFDTNDNPKSYANAVAGDYFTYTTTSGTEGKVEYLPTTDYFDLSSATVSTDGLDQNWYHLTYSGQYYQRIISETISEDLVCINTLSTATAVYRFKINHPGDIIQEMYHLTPGVYLTSANKSQDTTVDLYRPFADALQDIFDEQWFLEQANWISNINPYYITYLSYLLGFNIPTIPFYPQSTDKLRKTILEKLVELQKLKGSKRALIELFELLGFNLLISNLWYSTDGKRLIRPGERLPGEYSSQEIQISDKCQIEPLLNAYNTNGFGNFTIPLLYRPQQGITSTGEFTNDYSITPDITVSAYLVEVGSAAHTALQVIIEGMNADPSNYACNPVVPPSGIISSSVVTIKDGTDNTAVTSGVMPPLSENSVLYDKPNNTIRMVFNGSIIFNKSNYLNGTTDLVLCSFAQYTRIDINVPAALEKLNSNRFAIQVLNRDWSQINSNVLEFVVNFVFELKAFHSILYAIKYNLDIIDTYQVTDFCIGGDVQQRYNIDAGKLQTPPAIIPEITVDPCTNTPSALGYKPSDIVLRDTIIGNLEAEFDAWKALDGRVPGGGGRIAPNTPIGGTCQYNQYGQDRSASSEESTPSTSNEFIPTPNAGQVDGGVLSNTKLDIAVVDGEFTIHNGNTSADKDVSLFGKFHRDYDSDTNTLCTLDGNDYCYKGRVKDSVYTQVSIPGYEQYRNRVCLSIGSGVYYTYPNPSVQLISGLFFSGGGIRGQATPVSFNTGGQPLTGPNNNFLGRLQRAYNTPSDATLHYSNRHGFTDAMVDQKQMLALQRPDLDVEVTNMHLPGCRFLTMNKLESTYSSSEWAAKPWDDAYSLGCPPTWMNATLVPGTNGGETLVYASTPFTVLKNGYPADIPNLGDHSLSTGSSFSVTDVYHAVFSSKYDGHPAITLYDLCGIDSTGDYTDSITGSLTSVGDIVSVSEPLFKSARLCDTSYIDYSDGYPCINGWQTYHSLSAHTYNTLYELLGLDFGELTGNSQILFTLSSGIKTTIGNRLDCNCTVTNCGSQTEGGLETLQCITYQYIDQHGERDWGMDQLEIDSVVVLEEAIGVSDYRLDGELVEMIS